MRIFLLSISVLPLACIAGEPAAPIAEPEVSEQAVPVIDRGAPHSTDSYTGLSALILQDMQTYSVPGASLAIVQNGKLAFSSGYGVRALTSTDAVTPNTLFRVASLSKMVLAATVLNMGIDLNAPVTSFVPYKLAAGFDPNSITVRQLLNHTSGIPDLDSWFVCPVGSTELTSYFALDTTNPLWAPPGAVYDYSNRGYALAGWIVNSANQTPFEDAVSQYTFRVAGMDTATYEPSLAMEGDYATGYSSGQPYVPTSYDCEATRPAAGIVASAVDYAHFIEYLYANPSLLQRLTSASVDTYAFPDGLAEYGYGLHVNAWYKGLRTVEHDGSDPGYSTYLWMSPETQTGIVLFYNSSDRSPVNVIHSIVDDLFTLQDVRLESYTSSSNTWEQYVGVYHDAYNYGDMTVALTPNGLSVSLLASGDTLQLQQVAGSHFTSPQASDLGHMFTPFSDVVFQNGYLITTGGIGKLNR